MKSGQFVVLAIYEVHMASAAVMVDGQVVAATHEERFSRLKNDVGFPYRAAKFCMDRARIRPEEVDIVAFANKSFGPDMIAKIMWKRYATFKVDDYVDENERYWKPLLVDKKPLKSYFEIMGERARSAEGHYYDFSKIDFSAPADVISSAFDELRRDVVEQQLGIPRSRIRFLPNYMCHLYHAYYSGHMRGPDVLVIDVEGEGEGYNCVAAKPTSHGFEIIAATNECLLGRLYQWTTLLLGMRPYHHEYKVMGLAPWANDREIAKSFQVFDPVLRVDHDEMLIKVGKKPADLYYHFRDALQGHRFDGIAGAVQQLVENRLGEWFSLLLRRTGSRRVCYAGGVAMNIKANMKLAALETLEDFFVPLSPGDESTVFGAAYWMTEQHFVSVGKDPASIPPLAHAYWGAEFDRSACLRAAEARNISGKFLVQENVTEKTVAALLAQGSVVARYQGRSEFGQRALGNRSILANPSIHDAANKINTQIKYRDFWMPFAPTILEDRQHDYLENPKGIRCPFMTIGFPLKKERMSDLVAAIHPADASARPQILSRAANPAYYDLLEEFEDLTKVGALLNTSFNLHGEPNVDSPEDAIHTFENSELDTLWMHDILVSRPSGPK